MNFRTDLAVELVTEENLPNGVHMNRRGNAFQITEIIIDSDDHRTLGKGKGRYITLESSSISRFCDNYEDMAQELAAELKNLLPEGEVLVAGLGNRDITPDAIGPWTAEKILATRHLRNELEDDEADFLKTLRPVSCLAGGVLGQTGIETAELITAICREIKPSAVIAVDALACSDIERLGTTIQICDSGISPGSGVANSRKELSAASLGIPVIAVGIPTVVDMHTIVRSFGDVEILESTPNMMVTPRDIDRLAERGAELIACGINLALQPTMTFGDVRGLF